MTSLWRSLGVAAGLVVLAAGLAYGWPWSTDMDKQPSVRPQEDPRLPPPGSVPRQGKEPAMDRVQAGERLRNPVEPGPASIENGKHLFQIYCALCHGPDAKGGGPVASKFVPPPDLTLDLFRQRPDGFLYGTIRDGGALMPGQGDALSPRERWDIVNYLRTLQQKSSQDGVRQESSSPKNK
jgi:mono/diheme cytochrome c family protein